MSVGAPVEVASWNVTGTNASTSGAVALTQTVPAGTLLLLVGTGAGANRTFTPSSSPTLTWTRVVDPWPSATDTNAGTVALWWAVSPGLTTSDTVTVATTNATVIALRLYAVDGVDTSDPLADVVTGVINAGNEATLTLPDIDVPAGGMVFTAGGGGSVTLISVADGYTILANTVFTGTSSSRLCATDYRIFSTAQTTTPHRTQASGGARRHYAVSVAINPDAPPEPEPGSVVHMWTGAPTAGTLTVHTRTQDATSVRLAVSTSDTMTSPTYVTAEAPDSHGYVRHTATGLDPNTRYYVQCADTPIGGSEHLIGPVGTLRTLGTPGSPVASRKITIGGCLNTNAVETAGLVNALAWAPDWGHFNGDFFYNGNIALQTIGEWVGRYNSQINNVGANLRSFLAAGVGAYELVSDHDTTDGDNQDSDQPSAPYELAGWRVVVPHLAGSGDSTCRDMQWDDGRISYFMLDARSVNRTSGSATDDSSKTMLGSAQKARLFDWLANNPAPFKVIISDPPWMGAADIVAKPDAWWSYATERQQIIDAIHAQDTHVEVWHGDSHLIGYATPAKNAWGNFPVICAAPYYQDGGGRNSNTYSEFYNNNSEWTAQYGRITFTDDGETITRTYVGWDALNNVAQHTFVTEVDTSAPPALLGTWDTATATVVPTEVLGVWNGTEVEPVEVLGTWNTASSSIQPIEE